MPRIFVTGDTHRLMDIIKIDKFDREIGRDLSSDDYLIITGDFGGIMTGEFIRGEDFPAKEYKDKGFNKFDDYPRTYWEKKPYTVLFVDGNHENHDALDLYPVEEWNGGKLHRIYKNTLHLMRGQVYTIEGRTFFTLGGAESTDKGWRTEGFSWWAREMPSVEEYEEAVSNLEKLGGKVDYIITHCAPESTVCALDMKHMYYRSKNELTAFLDTIASSIEFRNWYFGHYHQDSDAGKYHMMYKRVIEI